MPEYDSRAETLAHSNRVGWLLTTAINELTRRAVSHDLSKTRPPELAYFDLYTPRLRDLRYPSPEYDACLAQLAPALEHHYAANPHHPEHYPNGINGMTLVDLLEMLADWLAAGERCRDGDLARSLQAGRERFRIGDQLAGILENTARHFGWLPADGQDATYSASAQSGRSTPGMD